MTSEEGKWMWLAAMIDGEGTIGIYKYSKHSYLVRLQVSNTSEELIDYLKEKYNRNKHGPYKQKEERRKDVFEWKCHSKEAIRLIKQIKPYLVIKREQAQLAIRAWEDTFRINYRNREIPRYALDKREEYYQQMKKLNQIGKYDEEDEECLLLKKKVVITLEEFGVE